MRLIRRNETGQAVGVAAPLLLIGGLVALAVLGASGAAVVAAVRAPPPQVKGFVERNYASLPLMSVTMGDASSRQMDLKLLLEYPPGAGSVSTLAYETRIAERLGDRIREIGMDRLQGVEGAKLLKGAVASVVDRELRPLRVRDVLIEKMVLH